MYDLTLDRRKYARRQQNPLATDKNRVQGYERRNGDRRTDCRPLSAFPFLPHSML